MSFLHIKEGLPAVHNFDAHFCLEMHPSATELRKIAFAMILGQFPYKLAPPTVFISVISENNFEKIRKKEHKI